MEKKLAIILPGMGYHKDKPLLYYSTRLAQSLGYEIKHLEYLGLPPKVLDTETLKIAGEAAYTSSQAQLSLVDFSQYADVLFIGKSIGTVVSARYLKEHEVKARQIWYTPVEETFSYQSTGALAFIGEADPASDLNVIRQLAHIFHIDLHTYPDCNHSLETRDVDTNLANIREVMRLTAAYIEKGE